MSAKQLGHIFTVEWQSGEIKNIQRLRESLFRLPHVHSIKSGTSNVTSFTVETTLTYDPKGLMDAISDVVEKHKTSQPPPIDIQVRVAQSRLQDVIARVNACRCSPPFSGEEYCTGACEARAMLMGVELLNAIETLIASGSCGICHEHSCDAVSCNCLCHKFADGAMNGAEAVFDKASGKKEK